jgi:hypothetical protein
MCTFYKNDEKAFNAIWVEGFRCQVSGVRQPGIIEAACLIDSAKAFQPAKEANPPNQYISQTRILQSTTDIR